MRTSTGENSGIAKLASCKGTSWSQIKQYTYNVQISIITISKIQSASAMRLRNILKTKWTHQYLATSTQHKLTKITALAEYRDHTFFSFQNKLGGAWNQLFKIAHTIYTLQRQVLKKPSVNLYIEANKFQDIMMMKYSWVSKKIVSNCLIPICAQVIWLYELNYWSTLLLNAINKFPLFWTANLDPNEHFEFRRSFQKLNMCMVIHQYRSTCLPRIPKNAQCRK